MQLQVLDYSKPVNRIISKYVFLYEFIHYINLKYIIMIIQFMAMCFSSDMLTCGENYKIILSFIIK